MPVSVTNRRTFLHALGAGAAACAVLSLQASERGLPDAPMPGDAWEQVPDILAHISAPKFRDREFDIVDFGAVGDNETDCTSAFANAIAACNAAAGGRVVVPQGEFATGAIHLRSNVNLHVAKGATIRFSRDPRAYPLVFTRWEGTELMNFSPFVYAFEQENIAITGEGTLDGNSDCEHWWSWNRHEPCGPKRNDEDQTKDRNVLHEMGENAVPVKERVFGLGHRLRPQFVQPYRCKNVLIEGVSLRNSPMWQIHPVLCSNVTVRGIVANSTGPNNDGCDPESCSDVLIEGCTFDTGDDCIAIKSGRNADGRRLNAPSQRIIVRDCLMKNGHGGVTIGSEISGGVRGVFAENCHMDSSNLGDALRIKNNAMRGGVIENIYVRNIEVGRVDTAGLSIDFRYEEGEAGKFTPVTRNVQLQNVKIHDMKYALFLRGLKKAPIENIRLVNCDFANASQPNVVQYANDVSLKNVRINGTLLGA
jgi:polygalacturonase